MFLDITANPGNIKKYQDNPKMMALINKLCGSDGSVAASDLLGFLGSMAAGGLGGAGGAGGAGGLGGLGGLFSGAGGATATPPPAAEQKPSAPKASDEVELD